MKKLATEGQWYAVMSLLVASNLALVYVYCYPLWSLRGVASDHLFGLTMLLGMFIAPVSAVLGFVSAIAWARERRIGRATALSLLTGLSLYTTCVCWLISAQLI